MKQNCTLTHKHVPANVIADVLPASCQLCCGSGGSGGRWFRPLSLQPRCQSDLEESPEPHLASQAASTVYKPVNGDFFPEVLVDISLSV